MLSGRHPRTPLTPPGRLVAETRQALGQGKTITMAYYPDGAQEHAIAVHGFARNVDLFLMMCYDQVR